VGRSTLFLQSLEKALRVLETFSQADQHLSLSEIASLAGLDKPAAQRCVHTLVQTGYIEKDAQSGRFSLGKKVLDLGFNFLRGHPLVQRATPVLLQLRRDCGERTNLSLYDETTLVYVVRLHGKREYPQHSTLIGRRMPTHCSAGGRAMLSRLSDAEIRDVLARSVIRPMTQRTLTDPEAIFGRIVEAREKGYGFVDGESAPGELIVAAPVVDAQGRPAAAVHIAGSANKWQADSFERTFAPYAVEVAKHLSHPAGDAANVPQLPVRRDGRGTGD
jgi:DNA-binding IclR family transcriptional regulator